MLQQALRHFTLIAFVIRHCLFVLYGHARFWGGRGSASVCLPAHYDWKASDLSKFTTERENIVSRLRDVIVI
ncbi:hypothetical protein Plhal710r2_c010g0047561 [Plasmopara halstedii]